MEDRPNYYAVIPANVRYDKELKDKAKLLYGEITALSNDKGYCYASNKYFADLYNVSIRTITDLIKSLIDREYLRSEIIYKNNTKEVAERRLYLWKKISIPLEKNFYTPLEENFQDNNTSINNINNNIKEIQKKYFDDIELNNLFIEFLDLRTKLKCKNTERAINLLIGKLNNYSYEEKIEMINNAIMNSWKSVYPIKEEKSKNKLSAIDDILKGVYNDTIRIK